LPPSSETETKQPQKKKKGFGRIQIQVPNLKQMQALENAPTEPVPQAGLQPMPQAETSELCPRPTETVKKRSERKRSERKPSERNRSLVEVDKLFNVPEQKQSDIVPLTLKQRLKNLKTFDPVLTETLRKQFTLECGEDVELLRLYQVEVLDFHGPLVIPDTSVRLTPSEYFQAQQNQQKSHQEHPGKPQRWHFEARPHADSDETVYFKAKNAYPDCVDFLRRLQPVKQWLVTLRGQRVPWQWCRNMLGDLGIIRQKEQTTPEGFCEEYYRVMCLEYHPQHPEGQMSIPMVPFLKLVLKP
jgi:hypothetical protein